MDFYKRVEYVCRQVPCGRAATYGQIALLCGMPTHSRQVGGWHHTLDDAIRFRAYFTTHNI